MSSSQSNSESISAANSKSKKGSEEGKVYEKLSLALLAKKGYELTKDNSEFCSFAIGREVGIGKDAKFDDTVFSYIDEDHTRNLIFVQIKHKQNYYLIDSQVLSAETSKAKAKGGRDGGMQRDFNLQKYFISYLSFREELKSTRSMELKNGKIKYLAILTNIGLNSEELNNNGFRLKKAPHDIINLFSLRESSPTTEDFNQCYQLIDVSDGLREIFMKSSDLHRLARELAQYVVWEEYRENKIMGIDDTPIKDYHVALGKHVIQKSDQIKNQKSKKYKKNEQYCEAQLSDGFLDSEKYGSGLQLRDALFEAIRQLDETKKKVSDDELKSILKKTMWKVVPNFGKSKQNNKTDLPCEWITVNEEDIADFLKCLVFIVNQTKMKVLEAIVKSSAEHTAVEETLFREILHKIENTLTKFRKQMGEVLQIDLKANYKEKWISCESIVNFIEEQKKLIRILFIVTGMTLKYEYDLKRFGKFQQLGKLEESLDTFLLSNSKILRVNSTCTVFSSIKILQYLNEQNDYKTKDGRISTNWNILRNEENRQSIIKAFDLINNCLLIIEYSHTFMKQNMEEFLNKLLNIVSGNPNKKIIFIIQQGEPIVLPGKYQTDFQNENSFILEDDSIELKDFVPVQDPIKEEMLRFQGQDKRVSLASLTGINCWNYYIDDLSQETFQEKQKIIDEKSLIEILDGEEIEIGSKPLGTSSLGGAYAILFEEISSETLATRLLYLGSNNNSHSLEDPSAGIDNNNDIYIISGIKGSSKKEKIDKLIQYLDLVIEQEEILNLFAEIDSDSRIQITDDELKHEDFKRICFNKPEKRIFWINIKHDENGLKFILRQLYNPRFYLKRNFKQVISMKEVKTQLMEKCHSEIFIFCCLENEQVLIDSLKFSNESEKERFKKHCKTGDIKLFTEEADAKAKFYELCKHNKLIHFFKVINKELNEIFFIKELDLIKDIKDKKVVIIAGEPGMGKTNTLTKLYETKNQHESFIETHWVIRINLNYHMQAIREINLVNGNTDTVSVVNFLSSVDAKLNHNLAKTLLAVALDKKVKFLKPLLLAFDGFDENLNEDVRNNTIIIFKFLKEESAAKLWITTSLRYKKTLENELSTFALEFDSKDDDFKIAYIKQYLEDRLCLSEKKITELFVRNNEKQEKVQMYTAELLDRIKSVFSGNICRIIGIPLQLYLMLDGSVRHFKKWLEKEVENLTFNYLGEDLWEVYEKFIDRKYEFYFQKTDIRECLRQKANKFIFNQYNEGLAISLILGVEPKKSLEEFKDTILSSGIIESHGNNIEFIHTTFRDYFAAKVFVQWIKKRPSVVSNSFKKEYILKEILRKPDYALIRCFINVKLKNVMETKRFEECLKHYGMVIEKLLREDESSLIDEKGTLLHLAVTENNKNIVWFLLETLNRRIDALQNFLFIPDKDEKTALHSAVEEDNKNIVYFMLNSLKGHTDILKKFLSTPDKDKRTPLNLAQSRGDDEIVKLLSDAEAGL